jgi:signal transduction histidine kinase
MERSPKFAPLVVLACHDLRTPLATVHGFARTLQRRGALDATQARYVEMIEAASSHLGELIDSLALVARIEAGRYEPALERIDTLTLAVRARDRLGENPIDVGGSGGPVDVDPAATERAIAALIEAARRHGGVERVGVEAVDRGVMVTPVTAESAPVVLADDLRDLGAAAARTVIEALGGSLELEGETLVVQLPAA